MRRTLSCTLAITSLACIPTLMTTSRAAEPPQPTLAHKVEKAARQLPRGCIIASTQTGTDAPILTVAGQQEPKGVPPHKVIFEIGSISKVFTGMLLAQAVLDKKVTLDTTLRDVMGPRQTFADAHVPAITLRQLATHTSGLPRLPDELMNASDIDPLDPYAKYDRAALDASLARIKLAHAPPFPFDYSNLGAGLLGDLLSRVYGADWERLIVDRITKPLGMTDTCVTLTPEQERRFAPPYSGLSPAKRWHFKALAGAGALCSTTSDMLRFAYALDRPEATPLKDVITMIQQPQGDTGHGLGLVLSLEKGKTVYWSQGGTGGSRSWISVNPATHEKVTVLINNDIMDAEEVLFGDPAGAAPKEPSDPSLLPFVGVYDTSVKASGTDIHYTFEVRGSDLWMQITGQPFIPLTPHPTKKDRFEFKPVKAEIQFTREKDKVISTTLFQSGLEINAKRLPSPK